MGTAVDLQPKQRLTEELRFLFDPVSIAVVGASADPSKAGFQMLSVLRGFEGELVAVNPREDSILGRACYPRLQDIPSRIDLAVLTVPPNRVPGVLRDAIAAGVRAAVVCAGGFGESGEGGAALQAEVAAIAREGGMRVLGPNTSGLVRPSRGLTASFVPAAATIQSGGLAVVAQSGGMHHVLDFLAQAEGIGISLGVGLGNAADVSFDDTVRYLADDARTSVIALHIEGVRNGRALVDAVAAAVARVPVVALVLGKSDVGDFARSHTGALTGNYALTRSALAQAGAVVVDDVQELIDAAGVLSMVRLEPRDRAGVGVVTGQAGPGLVIADTLKSSGVELPALSAQTRAEVDALLPPLTYVSNPVDTGRPSETFPAVLTAVARDPAIDLTVVYALDEPGAVDPMDVSRAARSTGQPTIFATGGPRDVVERVRAALREHGVPVVPSPDRAARAARALVADARARWSPGAAPAAADSFSFAAANLEGTLDEDEAKSLLEAMGFTCPRRLVFETAVDAERAVDTLHPPLVVKVCDAGIAHKSDVAGVRTGIRSIDDLRAAVREMERIPPTGSRRRYLVEEEAAPGVDLILGARRDQSFGPVVLLGVGGVAAEALSDVALRLAPLTAAQAQTMTSELRGAALLDGFRGAPAADRDQLITCIRALGELVAAHPNIVDVDLNPVRITAAGLVVLDALIVTHGGSQP